MVLRCCSSWAPVPCTPQQLGLAHKPLGRGEGTRCPSTASITQHTRCVVLPAAWTATMGLGVEEEYGYGQRLHPKARSQSQLGITWGLIGSTAVPTQAALAGGHGHPSPRGCPNPVTRASASQAAYPHLEAPNPAACLTQTPSPLPPCCGARG